MRRGPYKAVISAAFYRFNSDGLRSTLLRHDWQVGNKRSTARANVPRSIRPSLAMVDGRGTSVVGVDWPSNAILQPVLRLIVP